MLTVSELLKWTPATTHYISLRRRDGSVAGPFELTQGATADVLVLAEPLTITPYVGGSEERTYIAFGAGESWARICRVTAMRPRNGGRAVEIACVAEDERVHVN